MDHLRTERIYFFQNWRRRILKGRKEQKEKKRKGLSLKPLMIGMTVCATLLICVFGWAVLGSIHLESESGHGLGIVDAVNNTGLPQKIEELAAKPETASSTGQTMTAQEQDEETQGQNNETQEQNDEVQEQNNEAWETEVSAIYQEINDATRANPDSGVTDVTALEAVAAEEVRGWIEAYTYGEWPYLDGKEVSDADKEEILARRNLDALAEPVTLSYGVITQNAAVRAFPTWRKASKTTDENAFDYFQESMLLVGEPAVILHQTADGIWSFVQATTYRGWIETDHIAVCSLDELKEWEASDVAVVTDARLTLEDTVLRMGTSLPAKQDADGVLTVSLPEADENGQLLVQEIETEKEGIHFGYLALTQENILAQAKNLIGMNYGWGDSNGDMDCSSAMGAIYRCFGILLPRNTSQMKATGTEVVSLEGMTQEEKLELIRSMKPGTLLVMKGHVVMYIGQENTEDSILHNFTTCLAEDGISKEDVYQCRITPLNLVTASGVQYLDAYAAAICFPEE